MALGDLEAALRTLEGAERSMSGTQAGPQLEADLALARADLLVYLNESAKAAVHFERAAALYLAASDESRYREAATGAASLLILEGEHERAVRALQRTLAGQQGNVDPRSVARTRLLLAYAQEKSGEVENARRNLETALRDLTAVGDVVGRATALTALGDLEARQGASSSAKAFYREGLEDVAALEAPETTWRLYAGLGQILRQEGDLVAAERQLRAAIQQVEKVAPRFPELGYRESFFSDKWEVYAMLAAVQVERGRPGEAFETSERLRAQTMLALLDRGRFGSRRSANTALAEREQDLRRYVLHLSGRDVFSHRRQEPTERGSRDHYSGHVQAEESLYADLLRQLAAQDSEYPRLSVARHSPWPAVAKHLGDDVALVEYLVSDSTTLAFIVTSDTLAVVDLDLPRSPLADLVHFTRGAIDQAREGTGEETWRVPLQRLYRRLIVPVEATGLLTSKNRILIAAHDVLHYVPFHAFLSTHGDQFLAERYALSYVPSGSIWVQLRDAGEARPKDRILALSPDLDGMPGTRDEVRAIVRLYGKDATILTGASASEASFKSVASSYDILHLATAGALNQLNPLFSHVALAPADGEDGRLEVHEVFGLELDGQLVVLSACETGLASGALSDVPAGDDWVGLSRAFLTAGASAVMATLWRVDDRSAAEFTKRFYRGLRDERTPQEALREAQLALLRDPATADPYHWAAFALIGGS
jgi:CHAT domain-containing protein/Flp pilus assembly protein TadD